EEGMTFIKAFGLFIIITLGVTAGNLLSNFITMYMAAKALEISTNEIRQKNKENAEARNIREAEAAKERARRQEEQRLAREKREREDAQQRQVKKRLNETCDYWIKEYNRYKSDANRAHRDVACRQAGRPFN